MTSGDGEVDDLGEKIERVIGVAGGGPAEPVEPSPDVRRGDAVERLRAEGRHELAVEHGPDALSRGRLVSLEMGILPRPSTKSRNSGAARLGAPVASGPALRAWHSLRTSATVFSDSRERTRRFDPDLALAIETRSRQTVHVHKAVDAEGGEARLYCYSEARAKKEQGIANRFAARFEGEMSKLNDGLKRPRTRKRLDHVWQRIGRIAAAGLGADRPVLGDEQIAADHRLGAGPAQARGVPVIDQLDGAYRRKAVSVLHAIAVEPRGHHVEMVPPADIDPARQRPPAVQHEPAIDRDNAGPGGRRRAGNQRVGILAPHRVLGADIEHAMHPAMAGDDRMDPGG